MNRDEFEELSAAYALGALSEEENARFTAARARNPEWEALVVEDSMTAAALAGTIAPVEPPPAVRADLMSLVAKTPQTSRAVADDAPPPAAGEGSAPETTPAGPSGAVSTPRRQRRRRWFALAASLVALLALGGGTIAVVTQLARPTAVIALERIEAAPDAHTAEAADPDGMSAVLHWSPSLGEAVFVADDLPALPEDRAFELWFVREGEPISAGVFLPDGSETSAALEGQIHQGDIVALTIEPVGGSPSGLPTGDPIIAIPTG